MTLEYNQRGVGMEQPKKSKAIFFILALVATIFLTLFSFAIAATNVPMMILTLILFIATFGAGFTLKKHYREKNWF